MGRIFEVRKSKMFARYDRMAKQFTRIGKEIIIAVKAGGPDPDANAQLRRCMANAKFFPPAGTQLWRYPNCAIFRLRVGSTNLRWT